MKIMAVDLGDARTGLAVCDRTEFLASPIGVIHEKNIAMVQKQVEFAIKEYGVQMVVIGHPINMNGTFGKRAELAAKFAEKLAQCVDVPVKLWDERSTTVTAHNILTENETFGKKRKETVDAVAATIILESYLAYRKNHKED